MNLLDIGLWVLAGMLAVPALWWSRRQPRIWEPGRLFRGIRGTEDLRGAGEDWQPSEWLGAGITWDTLGNPGGALGRRLESLAVVWLGDAAFPLPGMPGTSLETPSNLEKPEAAWEKKLEAAVGEARQVVMAAGSANGMNLLKLLHAAPGLRDRCRAVLLVDFQPDPVWLAAEFTHNKMDTELYRQIPYLCLSTRPEGALLPTPPTPPTARTAIEVVNLGQGDPEDPQLPAHLVLLLAALAW